MPRSPFDWSSWGRSIRAERERRNISRQELAERCRLAPATLRNIEAGKHRPIGSTVAEICAALSLANPLGDTLKLNIDGFSRRFARSVLFCALHEYREARRDSEGFILQHFGNATQAQIDDLRCDLDRTIRLLNLLVPQVREKKERKP